jgi:drug/metabolite transporter (DMT)-like permease
MPDTPNPDSVLIGLALRLFAMFCLASMAALIKLAEARGASLVEMILFRHLFAVPIVLAWLAMGPGIGAIRTKRLGAHAGRSVTGLLGMILNFAAIMLLPLAEATTLQFTVPIFATILGALVLRETVGWHRWAAVALGFIGVLIVAQPGGGHFPLYGTAIGLAAALLVATISIQLRDLGKTEATGTTVFWFSVLSIPPLLVAYAMDVRAHDLLTYATLAALGIIGSIGQIALTGSFRFAPVSTVVPMDYSSIVWATLYGWLIFAVLPTPATWIGAPIIIASGLYIIWREHKRNQEKPIEQSL